MANEYCVYTDVINDNFSLPTGWNQTEVEGMITDASRLIDEATKDIFFTSNMTLYVDGTGKDTIYFFPYTKYKYLCDDSMVVTERDTFGDSWINDNNLATNAFDGNAKFVRTTYNYTSLVRASILRSEFQKGEKNYRIVANFGHASIPTSIKRACVLWTRELVSPGYTSSLLLRKEKYEDYSYETGFAPMTNNPSVEGYWQSFTGYPIIDQLLKPHLNKDTKMAFTGI
jgi:hypothetical protein